MKRNITYFIGDLFVALSQWAIITFVAKSYNLIDLGYFTYYLALVGPISYLVQMQHRTVYITKGFSKFQIKDFLFTRTLLILITFLVIIILNAILTFERFEILYLILFWKFAEIMDDLVYGYWQKNKRFILISKGKIIRSGLQILTSFLLVSKGFSLEMVLLSLLIVSLISFSYNFYKSGIASNKEKIKFSINDFRQLLIFTFPLAIFSMLSSIYLNIPKYVLEYNNDLKGVAIFSTISYLLIVGSLVVNSIIQVAIGDLSDLYEKKMKDKFISIFFKLISLILFLILIGIFISFFFGKVVLSLIYNQEIAEYSDLLIILLIGAFFNYSSTIIGVGLTIGKRYSIQSILSFSWCIFYALLSILFIDLHGVLGAGYAFIASSVIQFFTCLYFFRLKVVNEIGT